MISEVVEVPDNQVLAYYAFLRNALRSVCQIFTVFFTLSVAAIHLSSLSSSMTSACSIAGIVTSNANLSCALVVEITD